ncbi:MAG: response regulator [Proteobacteria bacterium]|nr:response regulator [Pseudomonadota bacterium]
MPPLYRSSLATRTLLSMVVASLLIFLIITAMVVWDERSKLLAAAHNESEARVASNMSALQLAAWSYSEDGIRAILAALTRSGALTKAEFISPELKLAWRRDGLAVTPDRTWMLPVFAPEGGKQIGELYLTESYVEVRQALRAKLVILTLTELLKVMSVALLLLFVVSRMITRPLQSLAKDVESLDPRATEARLTLARGKHEPAGDELELLVDAINRFHLERSLEIHKRQEAEEELRRHRDHLEELVGERTTALLLAKDAAEAASRAKSAFLANMSHELRTPMNAIMGMTHLALRKATEPKLCDQLGKIDLASQHLLDVINDILDISKIEAECLTLKQASFNFADLLENLLALIGHRAQEKHLKLQIDLAPEVGQLTLRGDPIRLAQILLNLAGNAIKFTERGSVAIAVHLLERTPNHVLLRCAVVDTGIGIASEDQQRLFTAFEQADASSTRKYGGTGLGLAISKRLAQIMGGEIGVDSQPGHGSTFWFTVRLGVDSASPRRPLPSHSPDHAEARLKADYAGQRVLLVEDEPVNQEVSRSLLEDAGLTVDLAGDGNQALRLTGQNHYDLILMDMQMPHLNGVDATRLIRSQPGYEQTPILAMTANAFDEDRQTCLAAGMNDHIGKPVVPVVLFETVLRWLAYARAGDS